MRSFLPHTLFLLLGLGPQAFAATLAAGGWFNPLGNFQECLLDPAAPCPDADLGISELEKALPGDGYSRLALRQSEGQEWSWPGGFARTGQANMDFRLLASTPLRTAVGVALYSPWPSQEWTRGPDSARMYEVQPSTHMSVLLGWDLLGFRESRSQQLLLAAEIPVAYGPGVWSGSLSYLPNENFRMRAEYAQVSPREEISPWTDSENLFKLKYTEHRVQGLVAGRFAVGPEWAGSVRYSQVESNEAPGMFTRDGSIWGASSQAVWLGRTWQWRNTFDAEYRKLRHDYTSADGAATLTLDGTYDIYHYQSRLQRTFFRMVRLGLQGERRLARATPGHSSLQGQSADSTDWLRAADFSVNGSSDMRLLTSLYGGDLRWWFAGLYAEAGGDYVFSRSNGHTSPLLTWGAPLDLASIVSTESAVFRLSVGYQSPEALYSYTYRKAYDLGAGSELLKRNGHHTFEISGRF